MSLPFSSFFVTPTSVKAATVLPLTVYPRCFLGKFASFIVGLYVLFYVVLLIYLFKMVWYLIYISNCLFLF